MDQKSHNFKLTSPLPKKRTGRPPGGKRSHPDYEKVTIYIRKKHHRSVDMKLRQAAALRSPDKAQGRAPRMDFSDLVDKLVADWDSQAES